VCVCVRARARVGGCVRLCVCTCALMGKISGNDVATNVHNQQMPTLKPSEHVTRQGSLNFISGSYLHGHAPLNPPSPRGKWPTHNQPVSARTRWPLANRRDTNPATTLFTGTWVHDDTFRT